MAAVEPVARQGRGEAVVIEGEGRARHRCSAPRYRRPTRACEFSTHADGHLEGEFASASMATSTPVLGEPPERRARLLREPPGWRRPPRTHRLSAGDSVFSAPGSASVSANCATPLSVVVDNARSALSDSLRCSAYVATGLRRSAVQCRVLIALRPLGDQDPRAHMSGFTPEARLIELAPLGKESVAELSCTRLEVEPDPDSTAACRPGHGRQPACRERGAARAGLAPSPTVAEVAATLKTAAAVARSRDRRARGRRSPPSAERLARAHGGARRRSRAALAADSPTSSRTPRHGSRRAGGARRARPGRPLRFLHPLIRSAIYEGMAADRPRSARAAHRRAAELLAGPGGRKTRAAVDLMAVDPAGGGRAAGRRRAG